jgi:DNA-binding transcriptional ArsR family regulator
MKVKVRRQVMNLRKKVNNESLYTEYVNILNGVLQLSNREAEVLSFILAIDGSGERSINSKNARSAIVQYLGISEPNLSKYLNTLKTKGLIVRDVDSKWVVNKYIRPDVVGGILEVTITLDLDGESSSFKQ